MRGSRDAAEASVPGELSFLAWVFVATLGAWVLIALLASATWLWPSLRFWPAPRRRSWQFHTFWVALQLMLAGIWALIWLDFSGLGEATAWRHAIGVPMVLVGSMRLMVRMAHPTHHP